MKKFISYPAKQRSFLISFCFSLVLILFTNTKSWAQKTWTGATDTKWEVGTNWSPSVVPTSLDDVIIPDLSKITNKPVISTNDQKCKSITIQPSGSLTMTGGSLAVSGNWTNNGTFNGGSRTVTFVGATNTSISGSSNTEFYSLTVDKGSGTGSILDVNGIGAVSVSNKLNLTKGLLRINNVASLNYAGALAIATNAGLSINGGTYTETGGGIDNDGIFTVSSGSATIGTNDGNCVANPTGGKFDLSGGTVNIAGRLQNTGGSANISGGTLILATKGINSGSKASFDMSSASTLSITGKPTIIIQNASTGDGGDINIIKSSKTKTIDGGVFQFGNASTPSNSTFKISSEIPLANLLVNSTNSPTVKLESDLTLSGNLDIQGGVFDASTFKFTPGTSNTNSGTIKFGGASNGLAIPSGTVEYNGTTAQTISAGIYQNLTTSGTGTKTIASGSAVAVSGLLTTNDKLTINSDETYSGSLIVNVSSNGKVTYKRWLKSDPLPANFSRWYITSAPVNVGSAFGTSNNGQGTNTSKIHMDGSLYDFATYNEVTNYWDYLSAIPGDLIPGKGYLISLNPGKDGIIQFTGELNNGDVNPSVTSTPDQGWNAIGNPYTSAIKIVGTGGFLAANTDNLNPNFTAIYVWNEDAAYSGSEQFYRVIGSSGYIPSSGALTGVMPTTNNVQAGQGFIIHSNGTSSTVSFTKSMQVSHANLSLKSSEISWPGITLLAESKGQIRSTVVAFNENMTSGLDISYDAGLLASDDFQVYTHLADGSSTVDFAVQCLPDMQTNSLGIPLGVDLPDGGELVFKAEGIILPDGMDVVLEDQVTGTKTKLKNETDTYKVTLSKNTSGIGRFYLSIAGQAITNAAFERTTNYTASFVNNRITIYGDIEPGTKAILFDLNGRKVGEYPLENINRNEISISGLTQTIFILKIVGRYSSQAMKLIHVKN